MPNVILRPSAIGDQDNYALIAGASKVAAVDSGDPVTHDDATSHIQRGDGQFQSFQIGNVPPGIAIVNSLSTGLRSNVATGGNITCLVRFNTTNGGGASGTSTPGTWTTFGPTAGARPGGGSYVPTDLVNNSNAFQVAVTAGDVTINNVSTMWMELDYAPVKGGFIAVFGSLVGAALGLHEMAKLAKYLFARDRTTLSPDEYLAAWEELRYDPRRRIFA